MIAAVMSECVLEEFELNHTKNMLKEWPQRVVEC